ncbi:hypothetical protein [Demequina lutea]|uniref:Uncharacterized protein n=1 Tax=Demequina lutea TaxID=431489 RepID=A0A7Z0CJN6_9MICO|nr:hypothetical protein [Demequina lutea]NYI40967.1 hypothetical protein [Demequina lutea]
MPDAPLSRRARRTFEEEAADRAASQDPTSAFAQAPSSGEVDAVEDERAALSRRDRRRMERLNHPLEAWTAEEEMLATGQIPAMTPERISEQERISREKAESAAQEATAASQEFRRLAASDIRRAPEPNFDEPVSVQVPSQPPVSQAPVFQRPVAQPQWAEEPPIDFPDSVESASEPSWPEPQPSPAHTPPDLALREAPETALDAGTRVADTHETRPVLEPYQPVMALDNAPLVPVVHPPRNEAPVEADSESAYEPTPSASNVFGAFFPPGSRQGALRQQDPFPAGSPAEPSPVASEHVPTLLPPQEVPTRDTSPVDEIRRLAAEAMSGIERASRTDAAAGAAATRPMPDPSIGAEFDSLQSASSAPHHVVPDATALNDEAPDNVAFENAAFDTVAPNFERPTAAQPPAAQPPATQQTPSIAWSPADLTWGPGAGIGPSVNRADADPTFDSLGDLAPRAVPTPATPFGRGTPEQAEFDQLTQSHSGATRGVAPASGQFPMSGPFSGPQRFAGPQAPPWATQPLSGAPGRAAEANDFTPLSNVPRPDFSGLYQQGSPSAFPPLTGAINTAALNAAEFHGGDMSASGQAAGIRRPDLPEVGGVKHFKWLHLSVIGALMFVLGVVIYNVAFNK